MGEEKWINKIHKGDVLDVLKQMPDNFVDMSITSPPYWCYDEKTEVLTENGWKLIKNVILNEKVMSLNPNTMEMMWTNVIDKYIEHYDGEMIHFKNKLIDLLVTPNHKMFVVDSHDDLAIRERKPFVKKEDLKSSFLREAKDVKIGNNLRINDFSWNGNNKKYFILPELNIVYNKQPTYFPPLKINMKSWLKFFGIWIAEGHARGSKGGNVIGRYEIGVKQKKGETADKIKEIFDNLPFEYNNYNDENRNILGFYITNPQLWHYLSKFGNSHTKFIPKEIKNLSSNLLKLFFDYYVMGDGCIIKTTKKTGVFSYTSMYSVSPKLRDDLIEIALKIGKNIRINKNYIRVIKRKNIQIGFCKKYVNYKGIICCLEIDKNHIILVKRNSSIPVFSGNSLRDYNIDGQIGLEEHPQIYIDKLVEVFHELKRVLKPTGSFFLNCGDTFFGGNLCCGMAEDYKSLSTINKEKYNSKRFNEFIKKRNKLRSNWLQPKQLLMVPYRLAAKMQDDGWILRNIICWEKSNPMPSSVKDRWNTSYEPIFFFVKNRKYFFDMDSIREPYKISSVQRYDYPLGHIRTNAAGLKEVTGYHCDKDVDLHPLGKIPNDFFDYEESKFSSKEEESKHRQGFSKDRNEFEQHPLGKTPTDIFPVNTTSFKGSHFAVFPPELLMKPIKACCPQQVCKKCGVPRERIIKNPDFDYSVDTENIKDTHKRNINNEKMQSTAALHRTGNEGVFYMGKTIGWTKCKCNAGFETGIALDPFLGSGTTAVVAKDLNRRWIGIELNPEYIKMAKNRIKKYVVIHEFEVKTAQYDEELIDQNEFYQTAEKHLPKFNTIHKYLNF